MRGRATRLHEILDPRRVSVKRLAERAVDDLIGVFLQARPYPLVLRAGPRRRHLLDGLRITDDVLGCPVVALDRVDGCDLGHPLGIALLSLAEARLQLVHALFGLLARGSLRSSLRMTTPLPSTVMTTIGPVDSAFRAAVSTSP